MSKDLHIAILEFGRDKLEDGVTITELEEHLRECGYQTPGENRLFNLFGDCYEALDSSHRGNPWEAMRNGARFSLSIDSTFRLLEHEELQSANKSSRRATYFATAALLVAVLSAGFSIYYSQEQLALSEETKKERNEVW